MDIIYKGKTRSPWREFEFMLHQAQLAIEPQIHLDTVTSRWDEVRESLAESTRKRVLQIDTLP